MTKCTWTAGIVLAVAPAVSLAQSVPASAARGIASFLPRGVVLDTVISRADSTQRSAVYLPSAYTIDRRWPLIFLMDPRGRALVPLACFQDAAERYGYVLVSSYGTRSDGPRAPNDRALDAAIPDAARYLSLDGRRLYLAGFSGTSRFAWEVQGELSGALAGIFGFGAGLPGDDRWLGGHVRGAPFAWFGAVGTRDPNYEEVRALDVQLAATQIPHALDVFDGAHEWPPAATCRRAVEWMEVQAIRRGWRPRDPAWMDSLAADRLTSAGRAGDAGDAERAWRLTSAVAADFGGLSDVGEARRRADSLGRDPPVLRAVARARAFTDDDRAFGSRLYATLRDVRGAASPPSAAELRRRLGLDAVRRAAERDDDSLAVLAARRKLNLVVMQTAFYEPREYMARRQFEHALAVLGVAEWVDPSNGATCLALTRVLIPLGRLPDALDKLRCAVDRRAIGLRGLESAADLAPLRDRDGWAALLDRARRLPADSVPGR